MASRVWSSKDVALSFEETFAAYSRLTSILERDGRFGMKCLVWGWVDLLSLSFRVANTGKWSESTSKLRKTLHCWTILLQDESMWSISFSMCPSLEIQKRWISFIWNQDPAMLRWCPLQNDSRRSVFTSGVPLPQGPSAVSPCILLLPVSAWSIEVAENHLEVVLTALRNGNLKVCVELLLDWSVCIFCPSIHNNEWQKSGGVPEPSTQQSLVDGGPWDACWHQLPMNGQCYSFLVFAIIPSWPDKCGVTNADLSTVQPPYFLETGHLDVPSLGVPGLVT